VEAESAFIKHGPEALKVTIPAFKEQTLELVASMVIVGIAPLEEVASGL
jgi:hypothetical protein